jgi:1-deoxy-D-xylulose 5-phosphate reductoisomerase
MLNTQDEHEAKALFRGRLGFPSVMTVIEAVIEKRSRMQTGFKG